MGALANSNQRQPVSSLQEVLLSCGAEESTEALHSLLEATASEARVELSQTVVAAGRLTICLLHVCVVYLHQRA